MSGALKWSRLGLISWSVLKSQPPPRALDGGRVDIVFGVVLAAHHVARWRVHPSGRCFVVTVSDAALLGEFREDVVERRVPGKLIRREGVPRGGRVPGAGLIAGLTVNLAEHARVHDRRMLTDILPGRGNQLAAVIKAAQAIKAVTAIIRVIYVVLIVSTVSSVSTVATVAIGSIIAIIAIGVSLHQRLLRHAAQCVHPVPRHGGTGILYPPGTKVKRQTKRRRRPSTCPSLILLLAERMDAVRTPRRVRPLMRRGGRVEAWWTGRAARRWWIRRHDMHLIVRIGNPVTGYVFIWARVRCTE